MANKVAFTEAEQSEITRIQQRNYIADGDASAFACILEDFHGQFGHCR